MRFVACLGTKDEQELIGPQIHHLRRIGVELIIVMDHGSTDRTLDILAQEERAGDLWLLHNDNDLDPDGTVRDVMLARETGAEWALFLDTDEFVLPVTGSLADLTELDDADVLIVETYDVALGRARDVPDPEGLTRDRYGDVMVYGRGPDPDQWPKVMARPEAIAGMIDGHHAAIPVPGGDLRERFSNELMIAHLAFTTLPRFERKVANIRRFHARFADWFADGKGSHWLEWLHADDEGRTPQVFESWLLPPAELERQRSEGGIQNVAEILESRARTRVTS